MKIGILGVGNIGGSIIPLLDKDYELILYTTNEEIKKKYSQNYEIAESEEDLINKCDYLFIAIKPQTFLKVFGDKKLNLNNKCIVSFCAGINLNILENIFIGGEIVRFMPNTAIKLGKSMTTVSYNKLNQYYDLTIKILNKFGNYIIVSEDILDKMLPLNGSMPAFIYLFSKYFVEIAKEYGIKEEEAMYVIASTLISSGNMMIDCLNLDTLIKNVSSKGGTTIAGLEGLNTLGFKKAIFDCYQKCYNRNLELSKK